jgi:hypothetical protein
MILGHMFYLEHHLCTPMKLSHNFGKQTKNIFPKRNYTMVTRSPKLLLLNLWHLLINTKQFSTSEKEPFRVSGERRRSLLHLPHRRCSGEFFPLHRCFYLILPRYLLSRKPAISHHPRYHHHTTGQELQHVWY